MHVFQRGKQCGAIGGAGEDHHHHAAAQDTDDDLAYAGLSDIPQLRNLYGIDHGKSNDRRRITGQLKGVGDVIGEMRAGPGTKTDPH